MGQVTSLYVWKVIRQVDPSLDERALVESIGLDPDSPPDPSRMVSDADYYSLLERIAASDPHALDLSLRVGASMRCDEYGAFGLAFKSAPNLRGSYERAGRYARILTNVADFEVEDTKDGALFHLRRDGERRLGLRLSNEATIAAVAAISREVSTGPFHPIEVYFKHPPPPAVAAYEQHFGCPVHFDSELDALRLSKQTLIEPNRLGDESIAKFFDTHLEAELSKLSDSESLDKRVRIQISQTLSEGVPKISDIGRRLGMSGRTLQRRLSDRGYTFQDLVDESRRELATRLLRHSDYPLAEVAFLTGFSEQSAFTRAFKRWAGQTPRSFRLQPPSDSR